MTTQYLFALFLIASFLSALILLFIALIVETSTKSKNIRKFKRKQRILNKYFRG